MEDNYMQESESDRVQYLLELKRLMKQSFLEHARTKNMRKKVDSLIDPAFKLADELFSQENWNAGLPESDEWRANAVRRVCGFAHDIAIRNIPTLPGSVSHHFKEYHENPDYRVIYDAEITFFENNEEKKGGTAEIFIE